MKAVFKKTTSKVVPAQAMRHTNGVEVAVHSFLMSVLYDGEQLASHPGRFTPCEYEKRWALEHCTITPASCKLFYRGREQRAVRVYKHRK
jgi:hypothetical protein